MSLKSRIDRAEAKAGTVTRRALAAELGGRLIVAETAEGKYRAANGKTYTLEELDRLIAACEPASPIIILDDSEWRPASGEVGDESQSAG